MNPKTALDLVEALEQALRFYMGICGNTAHSVTRTSAQQAYAQASTALEALTAARSAAEAVPVSGRQTSRHAWEKNAGRMVRLGVLASRCTNCGIEKSRDGAGWLFWSREEGSMGMTAPACHPVDADEAVPVAAMPGLPLKVEPGKFGIPYIADASGDPVCNMFSNTTPHNLERTRRGEQQRWAEFIVAACNAYVHPVPAKREAECERCQSLMQLRSVEGQRLRQLAHNLSYERAETCPIVAELNELADGLECGTPLGDCGGEGACLTSGDEG